MENRRFADNAGCIVVQVPRFGSEDQELAVSREPGLDGMAVSADFDYGIPKFRSDLHFREEWTAWGSTDVVTHSASVVGENTRAVQGKRSWGIEVDERPQGSRIGITVKIRVAHRVGTDQSGSTRKPAFTEKHVEALGPSGGAVEFKP